MKYHQRNWKTVLASRYALLFLIVSVALFLRIEGIQWGLPSLSRPYSYHPDEALILRHLTMMSQSSLNPHSFINPSLHFYLFGMLFQGLKWMEMVPPLKGTLKPEELARIFLAGRLLTTLMGLASILLLYGIGRRWYGEKIALLSAGFLAILPLHVVHSHYLTVEVPATFWILLAFLFFSKIDSSERERTYMAAGVASGLAASTKYTGVLCVPTLLLAYIYLYWKKGVKALFDRKILFFLIAASLAFFLGSPYFLISPNEVYQDILSLFKINIHAPQASYPTIPLLLYSMGTPMVVLALIGMILAIAQRKISDIFLLLWIVISFLLIIISGTPFTRHLVLMAPFISLIAARGSLFVFRKDLWQGSKKWLISVTFLILTFVCGWTFLSSYGYVRLMRGPDIRDRAAEWINKNIPAGSSIGIVRPWFYTPPLNWRRYRVERVDFDPQRLLQKRPEYFVITDFEYRKSAYVRRFFAKDYSDSEHFIQLLEEPNLYHVKKTFEITPSIAGITFKKGYPPHDWMYVYPTIRILERSSILDKPPIELKRF